MFRRSTALTPFLCAAVAAVAAIPAPAQAKRCPNIMFVVDKSGSMLNDPTGMGKVPSKWQLVVAAVSQTVNKYGKRIPFGLVTYSTQGAGGNICYQDAKLEIECGPDHGPQIIQRLMSITPDGNTNTGEGIKRAYSDGKLNDPMRGNYMVLITDGDPNCNIAEPKYTVDEITVAAKKNPSIHTFVVGFDGSGGVNPMNLNQMALAGLEPVKDCVANKMPCYYSASSQKQFQDAIDQIIGGLVGQTILAACDDSCFSIECAAGKVCNIPSACAAPICVPDLCGGVKCEEGMYCKDGHCLHPCPTCLNNEYCDQETCKPDACAIANLACQANQVCAVDRTGVPACTANLCLTINPTCPLPTSCSPTTGCCVDDPCRLVNCPPNSTCTPSGFCVTDPPEVVSMDMAVAPLPPDLTVEAEPDMAMEVPVEGCTCATGGPPSLRYSLTPLLIAGALLLSRRRRRADGR